MRSLRLKSFLEDETMAPCRRFALRVPATLEALDSWYFLSAIVFYMCNIRRIHYMLLLLYKPQTERNVEKQTNENFFNSEKSPIVVLGTLHYASCNPLAQSGFSVRLLETLQHNTTRAQSSPQTGQAQVCLQTTGLGPC